MIVEDHAKLARLMVLAGVTDRKLAELVGFASHSYVYRLRTGKARAVTTAAAQRFAEVLDCPIDALFTGAPNMQDIDSQLEAAQATQTTTK